jgi:hypothetical protein
MADEAVSREQERTTSSPSNGARVFNDSPSPSQTAESKQSLVQGLVQGSEILRRYVDETAARAVDVRNEKERDRNHQR